MKLLSLNTWAGKEFDTLIKYISDHSNNIDVFCFQEVFDTPTSHRIVEEHYRANLFSELKKVLPNHEGYFAPTQDHLGIDFELYWGVAIFLRKSLKVKEVKDFFIRGHRNSRQEDNYKSTMPYNLQYVIIELEGKEYTLAHLHGLWNGGGKTDTDERIEQSKRIKKFTDKNNKKLVVCGDFNLLPETKSLAMLEENLINLIKVNKVMTTRSKLYKKPEKFADYTLVSRDIKVNNFEVPEVEVSDHLPMILDFS